MKAKVSLKTVIVSALLLVCGLNASADNKSNLIYNSEEVNGMKVAETVYKMDGNTLANYMKYNYKYDDQNRRFRGPCARQRAGGGNVGLRGQIAGAQPGHAPDSPEAPEGFVGVQQDMGDSFAKRVSPGGGYVFRRYRKRSTRPLPYSLSA